MVGRAENAVNEKEGGWKGKMALSLSLGILSLEKKRRARLNERYAEALRLMGSAASSFTFGSIT